MKKYDYNQIGVSIAFTIKKCCPYQKDEAAVAYLNKYFDSKYRAYNYFVLAKNRIEIDPNYIETDENFVELQFNIWNKGIMETERVKVEHNLTKSEPLSIDSKYPHRKFLIKNSQGATVMNLKAAYVPELYYSQIKNKELLDYEILYIGRSVLDGNNVPALKRTSSHSTYLEILEDYSQVHLDKELFLFFFAHTHVELVDYPDSLPDKDVKKYMERINVIFGNPSDRKMVLQRVNLLESVLINYFKPYYNDKFSKVKPNSKHISFKLISELNLNKVTVEIGIEDFAPKLYTANVEKNDDYFMEYKF
jgi:hypothetical protein